MGDSYLVIFSDSTAASNDKFCWFGSVGDIDVELEAAKKRIYPTKRNVLMMVHKIDPEQKNVDMSINWMQMMYEMLLKHNEVDCDGKPYKMNQRTIETSIIYHVLDSSINKK